MIVWNSVKTYWINWPKSTTCIKAVSTRQILPSWKHRISHQFWLKQLLFQIRLKNAYYLTAISEKRLQTQLAAGLRIICLQQCWRAADKNLRKNKKKMTKWY